MNFFWVLIAFKYERKWLKRNFQFNNNLYSTDSI